MTTPVTTPTGGSTSTSVETVFDINVSSVTANVIYAHSINAGIIEAGRIVYGTSYGSTTGSTLQGAAVAVPGQLNAHDIHAGRVIANIIYVDSINH